jgi:septation ring formation regulator EzrA
MMTDDLNFNLPHSSMSVQLDRLLSSMDRIEARLETLEEKIEKIEGSTKNMDEHIDFVNYTYSIMRAPMNVIKNMTERFTGSSSTIPALPVPPESLMKTKMIETETKYYF